MPATMAGMNGRMPAAAASPRPWQMSRNTCMSGTVAAHDDRRRPPPGPDGLAVVIAGSRTLRRAVRGAHARHEVLGDARPDGDHRAPRAHLARRRAARHLHVPRRVTGLAALARGGR